MPPKTGHWSCSVPPGSSSTTPAYKLGPLQSAALLLSLNQESSLCPAGNIYHTVFCGSGLLYVWVPTSKSEPVLPSGIFLNWQLGTLACSAVLTFILKQVLITIL